MHVVAFVERSWMGVTPSGGAETMMADVVCHLVSQGWSATAIVANGPYHDQVIDGVRVLFPQDKNLMHKVFQEADVVITQLGATPQARGMAANYGKPLIQLIHNTSEYTVGFLADGCDFAIYNSDWIRDFHELHKSDLMVKSWQNYQLTKICKRRCFDWPHMVVRPPVMSPEQRYSDGEHLTLVNLTPNKGPDLFYRLAEANPDLKFMGVIGGYEHDKQVIRTDIPNVIIHQHVSDMTEIYSKTRVALVCSAYESYGRIGIEAAQYGIPTIASDTPGLRESLGDYGFIRDKDDFDGWNKAIRYTLEYYDGASSRARLRYSQLYQQSVMEMAALTEAIEGVARGSFDNSRSGSSF